MKALLQHEGQYILGWDTWLWYQIYQEHGRLKIKGSLVMNLNNKKKRLKKIIFELNSIGKYEPANFFKLVMIR
ncbi:TPA: hypothetical protein OXC77_003374 [Enterobacter roggenkampii]|nr:hypothetical protein [Enterobacter roggenkampii]